MKRKSKITILLTLVLVLFFTSIPSTTYAKSVEEGKYVVNYEDISSVNKKGNTLIIKTKSKKKISTYDEKNDRYSNVSGKTLKLKISSATQYFLSYEGNGEGFLDFLTIKELKNEIKNPCMQAEKNQLIIYVKNGKATECYCAYFGDEVTASEDNDNYGKTDLGFSLEDFYIADIHIYDCEIGNVSSAVSAYGIDSAPSIQGNEFYQNTNTSLHYSDGKCLRDFMSYTTQGILHIKSMHSDGNIVDEQAPCVKFPVNCGDSDKLLEKVLALKEGTYNTKDGSVYIRYTNITADPKGVYDTVSINYFNKNVEINFSYADGKVVGWTVFRQ